jgi:AbiJ-like protein/KAP-like P-loop domain-containing protein
MKEAMSLPTLRKSGERTGHPPAYFKLVYSWTPLKMHVVVCSLERCAVAEHNVISEVTRRAIIDFLSLSGGWSGRLSEADFLSRIYDLAKMPSTDSRPEYGDAYADIVQHRERNFDWTDDWVFFDSRFDLLHGPDDVFLKFLCETVHPVVRPDQAQVDKLLREYNSHLSADGWEIAETSRISGKPVFKARRLPNQSSAFQSAAFQSSAFQTGPGEEIGHTASGVSSRPPTSGPDERESSIASAFPSLIYTPRCARILVTAAGYTRVSRQPASYSLRSAAVLYALIDFSFEPTAEQDDAIAVLRTAIASIGVERYREARQLFLREKLPGNLPATIFDSEPLEFGLQNISPSSRALLLGARNIAATTSVQDSPSEPQIDTRHLLASSLTALVKHLNGVPFVFSNLELDITSLRTKLYRFIDQYYSSSDSLDRWAPILEIPATEILHTGTTASHVSAGPEDTEITQSPQAIDSSAAPIEAIRDWLPGVSSDRSREQDPDLLNIRKEVHALCSVIAAKDAALPLSIGLFGDWGSGKSFFMKEMEREISGLSTRGSPYCNRIVQLRFNAWHYIDTNLWASLTAEIFEGLATALSTTSSAEAENETLRMLQDLASSRDKLVYAEQKKREAEAELQHSEQRLQELEPQIFIKEAIRLVVTQPEVAEPLEAAADELNIPKAKAALAEVKDQLLEMRGIGGALLLTMKNTGALWVWLLAVALGFGVLALFLVWLLPVARRVGIPDLIARTTAFLLSIGGLLAPFIKRAQRALEFVQQANKNSATIIQKQQADNKRQIELEQKNADEARDKVKQLEDKVQRLRADRQMLDFIKRRNESTDYTSHLGVIARSHKDFRELSALLERVTQQPAKGDLPHIDRIVLYIDDLDRCPEENVMQVLQAVHLLLAFPLFVVIVGVDPRWLLHSVAEHSPALMKNQSSRSDNQRELWLSTPLNYLEKIFQIPFTLSPMSIKGYSNLVDELCSNTKWEDTSYVTKATVQTEIDTAAEAGAPVYDAIQAVVTQVHLPSSSSENEASTNAEASGPEPLKIEGWEQEFMKELYLLIPSPRAGKRFVNLYRLIRAMVEPNNWIAFVGNKLSGEYRPVLLLLAILVGYPAAAAELLGKLMQQPEEGIWWEFVDNFGNSLPGTRADGTKPELMEKLSRLRDLIPNTEPCRVFRRYAVQVARFSFQSGRVLLARKFEG